MYYIRLNGWEEEGEWLAEQGHDTRWDKWVPRGLQAKFKDVKKSVKEDNNNYIAELDTEAEIAAEQRNMR